MKIESLRLIGLTIRHLFPSYFALVMATGIVSIGALQLDMRLVAWVRYHRTHRASLEA